MLERPEIADELIASGVQAEYGLDGTQVTFLPLGYDVNTAVFRVEDRVKATYFLKLRKGDFDPITVRIPQYLSSLGILGIIAPLETKKGQLFSRLGDYTAILYPFIAGKNGYAVRLAKHHWRELGTTIKQIHTTQVPPNLSSFIPKESYDPQWREAVLWFQGKVEVENFTDPVAVKLARFMKVKRQEISQMVRRAEELARVLSHHPLDLVLCHSDAHPGNYLIAEHGELYLVDWDNPILAPKERDLMFFGSGMTGVQPGGREESWFYQGYGPAQVNMNALAYYRYERIIQDIAEFCKQLLLTTAGGEDRAQAYMYFTSSFQPGHEVEAAFKTDRLAKG